MTALHALMRAGVVAGVLCIGASRSGSAQVPISDTIITPITPPRTPFPSETATAGITKFSFIAYGDTRGAFDGTQIQYDHLLVVTSMIRVIQASANGPDPIKFVVQSGDAVLDGRSATQLSVSYVPVINRLTMEANVPYFLAAGNHDMRADSERPRGLRNWLLTNAAFIPPDNSPRRLRGYPTYGFGYGNTFFLLFDSIVADDSVQYNWIKKQLEGLDRRRYVNIVVACHHPAFSSGPHGGPTGEPQTLAMRERYMPLFRKHHVKLLL